MTRKNLRKPRRKSKSTKTAPWFSFFNILCLLLSAILINLSFLGHYLGILAWFGLLPFLTAINNKPWKQKLLLSFLFGFMFFLGLIYWLVHVSLFGLLILCLYLALEFSLWSVFLPEPSHWSSLIIGPALWILIERLRGVLFGGFFWGMLGYSQFENIALIQSADKLGVWGISFAIVLINFILFQILDQRKHGNKIPVYVYIPILYLVSIYTYGWTILNTKPFSQPSCKLSMIQPNIEQEKKWDSDYASANMNQLQQLSVLAGKDNPDLIVWPETAVPGYILDEPRLYNQVIDIARQAKTHLLIGSPREDYLSKQYYNSVFLFGAQGNLKRYHDKLHLVPFGEYIPYKNIFGFLKNSPIADFSAGKNHTLFQIFNQQNQEVNFGVLICFEDTFPQLVRKFKQQGADFMVTVTNEAWFKHSTEPLQHTAISVFRAIENRCWFTRSANTGISCFIDPYGIIKAKVQDKTTKADIFVQGFTTYQID
ncbi:MAG: apolipoprotein N-acyltransferase [Candidatus Omnitrophica bacterium]|nr:apolipoprotein N-acyltransferase [Candidatus Omnitrophota bacterium]